MHTFFKLHIFVRFEFCSWRNFVYLVTNFQKTAHCVEERAVGAHGHQDFVHRIYLAIEQLSVALSDLIHQVLMPLFYFFPFR